MYSVSSHADDVSSVGETNIWMLLAGIAFVTIIALSIYILRLKRTSNQSNRQFHAETEAARLSQQVALDQNEEIDTILANFFDIYIKVDRDWRILGMNSLAEQVSCKAMNGAESIELRQAFPDLAAANLNQSFETQEAVAFDIHCPKIDRWFEVHTYPRLDEMNIYLKDVTQRKQQLARAEDNERRLAAILNNALDGVITIDERGLIQTFNLAAEKIFGYKQDEIIGQSINLLMPDKDAINHDRYVKSHITTGKTTILGKERELQGRRKNGELFAMEAAVSEVIVSSKRTFIGVLRDISEKKRAEEHIRRLAAAIEHAADGVFITDVDGYIEYTNPAYQNMNGYSPRLEVKAKPRVFSTASSDKETYFELTAAMRKGEVWTGRYAVGGQCSQHQEESTITPVHDDSGRLVCYVGVCRDITKQLRQEERLRQSEKIAAVASLAAGIAHQFNNTLATITGYTEMAILDLGDDNPIVQDLSVVLSAASRAKLLVSQMIEFSANDLEQDYDLDPRNVTEEVVGILAKMLSSEAQISLNVDSGVGHINMSPSQFQALLMALGMNAIQAIEGSSDGQIGVRLTRRTVTENELNDTALERAGEYFLLVVTDNGKGISRDAQQKIFQPFYTTEEANANGMGLATVQGIAQSHGGAIKLDSSPSCGAEFTIYLPLSH